MKWLILFLFLFSDLAAQVDTSYELHLLRSRNVKSPSSAEIIDSNLATMTPPHLENGWHKWSELNFSTPRLVGKNERICIIVVGIVPPQSDLLVCTSLDTQNHNVVYRTSALPIFDPTHDVRLYGWHYYNINTLPSDYSIISLVWGLGSKPKGFDTVKIDAVYVYFFPVEDTVQVAVDTSLDTTVLLVKESIKLLPNGNEEVGIWNSVGVSQGKKSVNSFVSFENVPDGLYFTSTAQWFMKKGKRYFWRKK